VNIYIIASLWEKSSKGFQAGVELIQLPIYTQMGSLGGSPITLD